MRRILVVTTSRADYGIYRPVLRAMSTRPQLDVAVIASGAHLLRDHGETIKMIEADGWPIAARIELPLADDTAIGASRAAARALDACAAVIEKDRPDILVVLGDRYEMHAAALAALPARVPVAHIHGGEVTVGSFDEALRHGITKLSHLHFASTPAAGRRIVQLGEEPWRVMVTGAPGLDALLAADRLPVTDLTEALGIGWDPAPVLVSHHPATLGPDEADELVAALTGIDRPLIVTAPNVDPGGRTLRRRLEALVAERAGSVLVPNLGDLYPSVLASVAAMVGNSSSGIIEAPTFDVPVVNVGPRQDGRERAANVIDVPVDRHAIRAGIDRALDPTFRASLRGMTNPYGDGRASARIVDRLATVDLGDALIVKRFHDLDAGHQ